MRCATGSASSTRRSGCWSGRPPPRSPTSRRPRAWRAPRSTAASRIATPCSPPCRTARTRATSRRPAARCQSDASVGTGRSASMPSTSSTSCHRPCCPSSWWPRRSASLRFRSRCTYSTSTARICCTWPGRAVSGTGSRQALAVGPELDADGLADLREQLADFPNAQVYALWLRGRANGVMIAFGRPARAAQRARTPGVGGDHPRRPLHGRVCPGAAPQAADGGRRDPAEPAPAAHLPDHGRGGRRERPSELRGRGGLVRRDRERRRGLGHAGRRTGRLDPGGREQRRRTGCPASESP